MMVGLKRISTALGLLAAMASPALAQELAPNANQMTADAVARSLRASRNLAAYRIEIQASDGLVTLTGTLGNPAQKAEALARTQHVAGVRGVIDQLQVADGSIVPVQYQPNVALGHRNYGGGDAVYGGAGYGGAGTGVTAGSAPVADGGPVPEGPAGTTGGTQASRPGYPNYAWPSYAPYPNFSAVGYPTAYPWQAWPNIGPFYPYPEAPLDWRAVTLRWDDGIWWLDFKKNYTRPFITPYPFGIFAY
jgi:BON domain